MALAAPGRPALRGLRLAEVQMGRTSGHNAAVGEAVHVPHWYPESEDNLLQDSALDPRRTGLEDHIGLLCLRAAWVMPVFEARMRELAESVNSAKRPCEFGLDNLPSFAFDFDKDSHEVNDAEHGRGHVVLRVGAIKTEASALRKVNMEYRVDEKTYPLAPRSQYLFDLVRAEAWFADPYVMAVFMELLARTFEITGMKPKLFDPTDDTRNNVLVNLRLNGMVCEVQLMLYEHDRLKREKRTGSTKSPEPYRSSIACGHSGATTNHYSH